MGPRHFRCARRLPLCHLYATILAMARSFQIKELRYVTLKHGKTELSPVTTRFLSRTSKQVLGWWHQNDLNSLALSSTLISGDFTGTRSIMTVTSVRLKSKHLNVLEIGVGGYGTLNCWRRVASYVEAYFRNSQIVESICMTRVTLVSVESTSGNVTRQIPEELLVFQ